MNPPLVRLVPADSIRENVSPFSVSDFVVTFDTWIAHVTSGFLTRTELMTTEHGRNIRTTLAGTPLTIEHLFEAPPVRPLRPPLRTLTDPQESALTLPPNHLSPLSPDEAVIQQRGRRRLPLSWSPDIDLNRISFSTSTVRTPPKLAPDRHSPTERGVTLHSTPRKRLIFDDERIPLSPDKIDFSDISTPEKLKITSPDKGKPVKRPVTWSPDIDFKRNSFLSTVRTPPKLVPGRLSPTKLGVTLRSTPRKRLNLGDERIPLTPEKIDFSDLSTPQKLKITSPVKGTPPIKRPRIENTLEADFKRPIDMALKGLSPTQRINTTMNIIKKHPEIEKEIRKEMPKPDLAPLGERLKYLKSNIFKSLPTSRLTSKTDSPGYRRAATHLEAFKKCVIDQGKTLVESQHWESVLKYVFLAWSYVRATPVWDNQPHNAARKQCFKALICFCLSALKKGSFDRDTLIDVQDKLQGILADADEVQFCLKHVQSQIQS